jgi:hypothetical protein
MQYARFMLGPEQNFVCLSLTELICFLQGGVTESYVMIDISYAGCCFLDVKAMPECGCPPESEKKEYM